MIGKKNKVKLSEGVVFLKCLVVEVIIVYLSDNFGGKVVVRNVWRMCFFV